MDKHEQNFKEDVQAGLLSLRKYIPSKYLYDKKGCELFDKITHHPDYYLTECEMEILRKNKKNLLNFFKYRPFKLIELGPGEGVKTQILLEQFIQGESTFFTYSPVDISIDYLNALTHQLHKSLTQLEIVPLHLDYFQNLEELNLTSDKLNIILFLGSSIGNSSLNENLRFLTQVYNVLYPGDFMLIGFDLRKDIDILLKAYNDNEGITRQFNLNLLHRMNRELLAHFDVKKFQHYATYNVYSGAMESYLVSLEEQSVDIDLLSHTFAFQPYEAIHVENSYKYLPFQIEWLAQKSGFEVVETFFDSKKYFLDSLWCKV